MLKQRQKRQNEKLLRPIHPNAGIEADYRRRLIALIEAMHKSVQFWVESAFRNNNPEVALDELPASALRAAIRKLTRRWLTKFNEASAKLADYFAQSVSNRSDAALKKILKDGGISIDWTMTRAQQDVLRATINQNVALIKTIPAQYLGQVEGAVMRSVQTGRDLGSLSKELEHSFGVSKRRAAFISRSQNNLATAALTRARQVEIGVTEAVWVHSGGGKHPRPSHFKAGKDKQRYPVSEGWLDPEVKRKVYPGELPNCRCVSRSVIAGFG